MKFFKMFLIGFLACLFSGCQEAYDMPEDSGSDLGTGFTLSSSMSQEEFMQSCLSIKTQLGSLSRAAQLSEIEAKEIVRPFVEDGIKLRAQIVEQGSVKEGYYNDEIAYFKELSEEDCATLSFIYHSVKEAGLDAGVIGRVVDSDPATSMSIDKERLSHCLQAAIGLAGIKEAISVSGLISATTARQLLIVMGKRYLGYIGIAYMVYEFAQCISE